MKYKVLRKFANNLFPIGSIIDASNLAGLINIDQAVKEGSIEAIIEHKMVSSAPENKAIEPPENKALKIEVS